MTRAGHSGSVSRVILYPRHDRHCTPGRRPCFRANGAMRHLRRRALHAFLPECGEKRAADRSYSIFHFTKENVIDAIGSLDGRTFRTLKLLLLRPGELTAQFMRGARLPYLSPLQLFLALNLLFFVWSSAERFSILDTPLSVHTTSMPWSQSARAMAHDR